MKVVPVAYQQQFFQGEINKNCLQNAKIAKFIRYFCKSTSKAFEVRRTLPSGLPKNFLSLYRISNTLVILFHFLCLSICLHQPSLQRWQRVNAAEIFLFWIVAVNFLCRHGSLPSEKVYFLIDTGSLILNNCVPVHGNHSTGSLTGSPLKK